MQQLSTFETPSGKNVAICKQQDDVQRSFWYKYVRIVGLLGGFEPLDFAA